MSKMIWNEELSASLDQSSGAVVFHRIEATKTQQLAQSLADKLGALIEQNEKALDAKLGASINLNERTDGTKQEKRGGDQTAERRRNGERKGGAAARSTSILLVYSMSHLLYNIIFRCSRTRCSFRARSRPGRPAN